MRIRAKLDEVELRGPPEAAAPILDPAGPNHPQPPPESPGLDMHIRRQTRGEAWTRLDRRLDPA